MRYDPEFFADEVVLVTGGTGSFGETIVNRLLRTKAREIRVFSRDEQKHVALQRKLAPDSRLKFIVGDCRDEARVREVVRGATLVFHAAAIKHVHLTEMHPKEAVKTNILGAAVVTSEAERAGVKRCVAISTDKAVQPVNVMGMTKALQERIVAMAATPNFVSGCVRYGNVLASNGSVVPFFRDLLQKGIRKLPITHPDMTRFMLTLDEGVDLALFAMMSINPGEIVVYERPAFLVKDLAEVMLQEFGGGEIDVVGIRPGEKLHEVLVSEDEARRCTKRGSFTVIRPYSNEDERFGAGTGALSSEFAPRMSHAEIRTLLKENGML
jgi:UDP-glucose 4-epimerase